jgi:hypothetical protein
LNSEPRTLTAFMPSESKPARLVVCERTGRWAVALRRELADAGLRVWETRSLMDCGSILSESPASFVVLELRDNKVGETLDFISKWQVEFPLFRFSVVAERTLAPYRWLMQEAGATTFLCSIRRSSSIAQIACLHLAHVPPPVPLSLSERIWANLPWGRGVEKG